MGLVGQPSIQPQQGKEAKNHGQQTPKDIYQKQVRLVGYFLSQSSVVVHPWGLHHGIPIL